MGVKLRTLDLGNGQRGVAFYCPGCQEAQEIPVSTDGRQGWAWNGSLERPTLSPSLLTTSGHYAPQHQAMDSCWCTLRKEQPELEISFQCRRCHSFIRDGRIEFLSDCSHPLAGQRVELPDITEW